MGPTETPKVFNKFVIATPTPIANPHWHTAMLKHYLAELIHKNQWNTYALANQPWLELDNPGKRTFIVGAFVTHVLNANLDRLLDLGVPMLFVVEDYREGKHNGDEYVYYCKEGRVEGHHVQPEGKYDPIWYDENVDHVLTGKSGPVNKDWCFETLLSLGPQRLIYIHKGTLPRSGDVDNKVATCECPRCVKRTILQRDSKPTLAIYRLQRPDVSVGQLTPCELQMNIDDDYTADLDLEFKLSGFKIGELHLARNRGALFISACLLGAIVRILAAMSYDSAKVASFSACYILAGVYFILAILLLE